MELTDNIVVKTLAEFMGIWPHDAIGEVFKIGSGLAVAVPFGDTRIARHFPAYLTDYTAIAAVWRRVDEMPSGDIYTRVRGVLDDDGHWRSWYQSEPRDHAYALAQAIIETKEAT